MTKDWFKYETVVYETGDRCYMQAASSSFSEFIFSWQRIAAAMYPMGENWMIERGKRIP